MRAKEFLRESVQTISLEQLYQGDYPDRDEEFWDHVRPGDFKMQMPIQTMQRHIVMITMLGMYQAEHIDEVVDMLEPEQLEVVQRYENDPDLSNKIVLVSDHRIIDGNHRALAAALKGVPIKYVELTEDLDEAELDPTGWGNTPQGTDVDYFGTKVIMRPSMFLKLAAPLTSAGENPKVVQHMEKGGKIAYPFLDIKEPAEWEAGDFTEDARVKTHEGRNRMKKWIEMKGDEPIQVNLFFRGANRSRYITKEMIARLNQGMISETGNYVAGPLFRS
jgi:hypothetical protein